MSGYKPLYIKAYETGLVQNRQEFILPDDAYPVLENAFLFREQLRRRQGLEFLGRLKRNFTASSIGNSGASPWTFTIFATVVPPISLVLEPNAEIVPGTVIIDIGGVIFTDQGDGTLTSVTPGNSGIINYITSSVTITTTQPAGTASTITYSYSPGLPVMGIRTREVNALNEEETIIFDTRYAYDFFPGIGFREFITTPPNTWTGTDYNFFWSTNYWVSPANVKLMWVTNFSGTTGDPIRYTDGVTWTDFAPTINAAGDVLGQALAMLPFRGRLLAFNTIEGPSLVGGTNYFQRIRWSAIGSPLTANAWRDDIRGQGGFLDIPTAEDIIAVGFVRDNLVIYCERSTWQLRYTGRSIAPFQIEKVNTELGADSTFSAVQFDTSLMGIGDKGVVECDSYKSERIDIKIPDLVFFFDNDNNGPKRVHGIRDQQQRLAFWIYPFHPGQETTEKYPNRRLLYNYENDSWAIFTDSLTALGTFQPSADIAWQDATFPWEEANFPWLSRPSQFPAIIGGNQQGFVVYLGSNIEPQVSNEQTLSITAITGNTTTPTVITSPNHNMETGQVIQIINIPTGTPFDNLNDSKFGIVRVDDNNFELWVYNPATGQFSTPQLDAPATYIGGGKIELRDGFIIQSKKFNFLDQGTNVQMGYIDILMSSTDDGAITLNVFSDYNSDSPVNVEPQNNIQSTSLPDTFFNSNVPTSQPPLGGLNGSKYWQRVFCSNNAAFLTLQWTLSNAQLIGPEQESDVQIDSQVLWMRPSGRLQTF